MSEQAIVEIAARIGALSTPGVLVLILWAGYRGVWVWGRDFRKVETEKDYWRSMALRLGNITERAVSQQSPSAERAS